ncbi:MobH family relaxase [Ottowia sp.]|uniref:MobH family relaxase n=1 Tax=Ottowia sp. TaxID=1898956 RepID=UPI003A897200
MEGTQRGWLRVLPAQDLLAGLRADDAIEALWRQSRLADAVWQRDLLSALHRYAEFVQLMPASESHHHAHAGGLLAHTLEMALAAVTWRNGHLLPAGASIEQIDDERDVWTYVVFHAALLHDIAKPMTDLRISWRAAQMPEALRWTPVAGSLLQLTRGRAQPEYLVEFTPKSQRDYGAHSRLAVTLLSQIAAPTALSFMARTPQAMDALVQYLYGHDKTSLVARIVSRADQASSSKALKQGSRARFESATSVPLIELLMGALKAMLKSGTTLPLNRNGAAGWVYDDSVWLVAKRASDAVRAWLKQHAPDEGIPGDSKNDRLFDTWQEYGCIQPNPQTGQAIWYVVVHGMGLEEAGAGQADQPGQGAGAYSNSLSMLRFPLAKLYDDASQYPPAMNGRIEIKDKRPAKDDSPEAVTDQDAQDQAHTAEAVASRQDAEDTQEAAAVSSVSAQAASAPAPAFASASDKPTSAAGQLKAMRAPGFNQPKAAAKPSAGNKQEAAAGQGHVKPAKPTKPKTADSSEITIGGGIDGFDAEDDWLDDEDDARLVATLKTPVRSTGKPTGKATSKPPKTAAISKPEASLPQQQSAHAQKPSQTPQTIKPIAAKPIGAKPKTETLHPEPEPLVMARSVPDPVVLMPSLPELPQDATKRKAEPTELALAFIQWLQQGLASRELKYNESGASVHFTGEGLALVSPLIFKLYAREIGPEADADMTGLQVQREVLKAGWHMMVAAKGAGKVNIVRYEVLGRGGTAVAKLSAVVLLDPERFVLPVPPANPVLKLA